MVTYVLRLIDLYYTEVFFLKHQVYNLDYEYILSHLDKDSVDLLILDPDYRNWGDMCEGDLFNEAMRVLKDDGNCICFTKQPFDLQLRNTIDPWFRRELIWSFTNGGAWCSNKLPLISYQKIYHIVKNTKKHHFEPRSGMEYSENIRPFKRKTKVFEGYYEEGKQFTPHEDGIWLRDHLHFNKPVNERPGTKPQELYDVLIKCYCPEEGIVVDLFAGSFNTLSTCINQKKSYIGNDIDVDSYKIGLEKLKGVI